MIKIILGSNNKSKRNSIEIALREIGISSYEIISIAVDSKISSKPINEETLVGAKNRNKELLTYCITNNIEFDFLISIEGGYEQIGDNDYFIVTYASIVDKLGNEFIGKSQGLPISKKMFEWVKDGKSLNKVIEEIEGNRENKKSNGISGYLTYGYYYRSKFDSSAIISAMQFMNNKEGRYHKLEKTLLKQQITQDYQK